MEQTKKTLTILFADISASTSLYESLGNEAAHLIVEEYISALCLQAKTCSGDIIKTMGDGIMCSFDIVKDAADAAIKMNEATDSISRIHSKENAGLDIRTGFYTGDVITDAGDIFGDAVNVAARLNALAKPRQILTSGTCIGLLPEYFREKARFVDRTTIKGKSGEHDIFEIVWEEGNQTVIMNARPQTPGIECYMNLAGADKNIRIDSSKPSITIGRQEHNDIMINDTLVSRTHCRIEYHKGKFILRDQSSNGSYIHNEGGYTVFVHNDESVLGDSGFLSLGHDRTDSSSLLIYFNIKRQ